MTRHKLGLGPRRRVDVHRANPAAAGGIAVLPGADDAGADDDGVVALGDRYPVSHVRFRITGPEPVIKDPPRSGLGVQMGRLRRGFSPVVVVVTHNDQLGFCGH